MKPERRVSLLLAGMGLFALAGAAVLLLTAHTRSPIGLLGYRLIFIGLLVAPSLSFALVYGLCWRVYRGALWRRGVGLGISVTALGHLLFGIVVFVFPLFAWAMGWTNADMDDAREWLFGVLAISLESFSYTYATFPCGLIAGFAFVWLEGRCSPSPSSV